MSSERRPKRGHVDPDVVSLTTTVPHRVLTPDPVKPLLLAIGCAAYALVRLRGMPDSDWNAWLEVAIWATAAGLFASQLLPRAAYLELGADSFEVKSFFRRWSCPWRYVGAVEVQRPFGFRQIVVFKLAPGAPIEVTAPACSRWLSSGQGVIPDTYGLSAEALARLMDEYRSGRGAVQPAETSGARK